MRGLVEVVAVLALVGAAGIGALYWMTAMPGEARPASTASQTPAAAELARRLRGHVENLAAEIGVRREDRGDSLERARDYIAGQLEASGYAVHRERFGNGGRERTNVEATRAGGDRPDEVLVVGAHYDTVAGSPGANDNASGVAVLLELARALRDASPSRTVRFVAFANEEAPFFGTDAMGSRVHARRARERGERIVAMISLEMLGCFSDQAGSQRYPRPLAWFYPDTGDFVGFVGNAASRALVRRSIAAFRETALLPSEGFAAPASLFRDIGRSDHASFWAYGYPALMVTDTAGFRYPFYHTALDTPDGLDYRRMALAALGLEATVVAEANRP
jgi:Zn-dependent M28 family amino/carboxypeptidase